MKGLVLLVVLASLYCSSNALDVKVAAVTGYKQLRSFNQSALYSIQADTDYDVPPYLIYLAGSRYDVGYSYGYLLTDEIKSNYQSLMQTLVSNKLLEEVIVVALDWQWRSYLSKELPEVYKTELQGLADGAKAQGCDVCGQYITRGIVLANAPGDIDDFIYILLREMGLKSALSKLEKKQQVEKVGHGLKCSMFAVWGSRTEDGQLFSGRNLDWTKDTGINKYKLAMVTAPSDGAIPSVSIGFVGLYGTIAGMSQKGLTVHEANLEENEITFTGFPWVLRLRYIMENANDLSEGKKLWEATKNTVGFNHMIASSPDAVRYKANGGSVDVAYAIETMFNYSAFFADNDPREEKAYYNPPKTDVLIPIGFPIKEAVWRTNHGYDPVIRAHYEWSQAPSSWSLQRYMFIHKAFLNYEETGVKIGATEALNITAIAGNKGTHAYTCEDNTDGSNVVSTTFQPSQNIVFAAWERSSGANWRPGTCSTYIKLDMSRWFNTPS